MTSGPGASGGPDPTAGPASRTDPVVAVSQLVINERQYRVRRLPELLASCFHPDATVTTSWMHGNAAQFVSASDARTGDTATSTILNRSGPPVVHLGRSRALVELPSTTTRWLTIDGVEAELQSYMRLLYRVEQRELVWKISDLTAINEGDSLSPAVPGTVLTIDPRLLVGLRHSYRFLAYTRSLGGERVSDDLYGIDRPGPVEELYASAHAWVQAAIE